MNKSKLKLKWPDWRASKNVEIVRECAYQVEHFYASDDH